MSVREVKRLDVYLVDAVTGDRPEEPVASVTVGEGQTIALHVFYDEEIE